MNNMSDTLSQYDAHLQAIVSEYKTFGQMRMAKALSPAVRERIQAEITHFVQTKKQQLDAASKLLAGLADFSTPAPPAESLMTAVTPLAPLVLEPLPLPSDPVVPQSASFPPTGVVRIATEEEWNNTPPPPVEEVCEELPSVEEVQDNREVEYGHDGHEDRPRPRKSRGSAAPVGKSTTVQRSADAPSDAPVAIRRERKIRKPQRKKTGMAAIESVSSVDIKSNAVGGLTGDGDLASDPNDFVSVTAGSRDTDPEAASNNDFDRVVQRTRQIQANAKMDKSEHPDSVLLIPEARIIDSAGTTVGRAARIYKTGKQIEIDEIELYLGDDGLNGDWSSEIALADGESVWRSIIKRREIFEFRGSSKVLVASLGTGRLLGFDESDENVLVVEEVVLTKAPDAVGGTH